MLFTMRVFLWAGFSRGLPHLLRVLGEFKDPHPWVHNSDAAAFAEKLVTTDDGTGMEIIVQVAGNIIEPGQPGALFFRCGGINIWDRFYDQLCVHRRKRRAALRRCLATRGVLDDGVRTPSSASRTH